MADVKWVKLYVDMFDNRKIKLMKNMPEGKSILLIWIQLIVLAGQINDNGAIYFTKEIPYTDDMLAIAFDEKIDVVRMALNLFKKFQMIDILEDVIYLSNWSKYQSLENYEKQKELNSKRVKEYRQRLALIGGTSYQKNFANLLIRDEGKCVYCNSEEDLVIDHLIPIIKGGDNEVDNLVICCKKCNSGKSGRFVEEARYTIINKNVAKMYEKTKKRLENYTVTQDVTLCHAIDKELDIELDKELDIRKNNTPIKQPYGEFKNVLLTEEEYKKVLAKKYGDKAIEKLSAYLASKKTNYKSHYAVLNSWVFSSVEEEEMKKTKFTNGFQKEVKTPSWYEKYEKELKDKNRPKEKVSVDLEELEKQLEKWKE